MTVHHVVPASYPGSGPIAAHLADPTSSLLGPSAAPPLKDLSWRWLHHDAQISDPDGHLGFDVFGIRFNPIAWSVGLGGGDGPLYPTLGLHFNGGADVVVDVNNTPIWTLIVTWRSLGIITNSGDAPTMFSASPTRPGTPTIPPQPIVGNAYTNGPWILYLAFTPSWVGGPGDWTLTIRTQLKLSYGGSGGTTVTVAVDDIEGGTTLLEFDNTAHTIALYTGSPGAWTLQAETAPLGAGAPGGLPVNQLFGGGNMGPYYWSFFVHLFGYIEAVAVIGDTAAYTTKLLDAHSIEPGTGPPVTVVEWRTVPEPSTPPVSGRLADYAHYWPCADASPGPLIDIAAGTPLTVDAPSLATFRVDGEPGTVAPHDKGIRLGPPSSTAAITYLRWGGTGVAPTIGPGGLGHDFSITMRRKWEGPPLGGISGSLPLFVSGQVPFGGFSEIGVAAYIGPMFAEPYGVLFQTWDHAHSTFNDLKTADFDWPAGFEIVNGVPTKIPVWAHVAFVYRAVGAAIQKEIWIDGVLLASGAGDPGGWGASVNMLTVGGSISGGGGRVSGAVQDLALWPFALTADELATLAG